LTQLIERFDILKSKSMDGTTISRKNEAWHRIACLFNAHQETKVKRTPRQLKKLWNNMKHRKQIELRLKKHMEDLGEIDASEVKIEETPIVEFFDVGDGYRDQESILVQKLDEYTQQHQRELNAIRLNVAKEGLLKAKAETEKAQAEARKAAAEEELAVLKLKKFKETEFSS
ncbi:hypothetical protein AMK59_2990, partial [Oryctes borbonicus]